MYAVGSLSYKDFGIENNSHWAVWEAARIRAAGVAINSPTLTNKLMTPYSSRDLALRYGDKCFTTTHPSTVNPTNYKTTFVLALFGSMMAYDGAAFIQTDKNCDY
jgi:hypothetical protein